MKEIATLQDHYFNFCFNQFNQTLSPSEDQFWQYCIDWAIERLQKDEEEGDLDVIMLAAAVNKDEAKPLIEVILNRYLPELKILENEGEWFTGKFFEFLNRTHIQQLTSDDRYLVRYLDIILMKLASKHNCPEWLSNLSRLSENIFLAYENEIISIYDLPKHLSKFKTHAQQVAELLNQASSLEDFHKRYALETPKAP